MSPESRPDNPAATKAVTDRSKSRRKQHHRVFSCVVMEQIGLEKELSSEMNELHFLQLEHSRHTGLYGLIGYAGAS